MRTLLEFASESRRPIESAADRTVSREKSTRANKSGTLAAHPSRGTNYSRLSVILGVGFGDSHVRAEMIWTADAIINLDAGSE